MEAAVQKLKSESNPEESHEPKGRRGRPKSNTGAASSSAAAATKEEEKEIDSKTNKSHWNLKSKEYILDQLKLRGFDNNAKWDEIQKLKKPSLLKIVMEMIANDNW